MWLARLSLSHLTLTDTPEKEIVNLPTVTQQVPITTSCFHLGWNLCLGQRIRRGAIMSASQAQTLRAWGASWERRGCPSLPCGPGWLGRELQGTDTRSVLLLRGLQLFREADTTWVTAHGGPVGRLSRDSERLEGLGGFQRLGVKPHNSDWDLNPWARTRTWSKPRWGLESTVF